MWQLCINDIYLCFQIVLCQNNIHQQSHMNRVVTHELIHAFDHCRAHVDWFNNLRHLACSEVSCCIYEQWKLWLLCDSFSSVCLRLWHCVLAGMNESVKNMCSTTVWHQVYQNLKTFLCHDFRSGQLTSVKTAPLAMKSPDSTSAWRSIIRYLQWDKYYLYQVEVCVYNLTLFSLQQECVRGRALRSILAVRKISREEAEKIVDEVFDSCFNDHAPFGRIPHSKKDAGFAYRDYQNRDRYYANL